MTYQSKTTAWPHQEACREWIQDRFEHGEFGLLLGLPMGVGKSKLAVDLIGEHIAKQRELFRTGKRKNPATCAVLVLCPLSVVNVWPREFQKHCADGMGVRVVTGKQLNFEFAFQESNTVVCVLHYEAAWREPMASWLLEQRWDFIVCDESHKFKAMPKYRQDASSGEWKASDGKLAAFMSELGRRGAYRLALTGTPMAHSPGDIFSQFRFLDAGKRFGNSVFSFMNSYHPISTPGAPWVNQRQMSALVNEIMWTCPEDVVKLPEAIHEIREFDLGPVARQAYKDMWRELVAEVEEGTITAANGGVRFLRLQQITSGIGKLDENRANWAHNEIVIDTGKQQLLEEFLDDIDPSEKVVVFCQFRAELAAVKAAAAKASRVYGEISGSDKGGLSPSALYAEGASILAVQLQSGGVGIDLSAARYCVYFSPGLSLANYLQSLKRVWRPGQTRPVLFLHLIARATVDGELYKRLEARQDLVDGILELARAQGEVAA